MEFDRLSHVIIGAGIMVHKALGPGLLESAYEACTAYELTRQGLYVERQKPLPLQYKGVRLDCGYRMDMVVEGKIIVEIKAVAKLEPIHDAQMITYQRLLGIPIGLIMNFNVARLKDGTNGSSTTMSRSSSRSSRLRGEIKAAVQTKEPAMTAGSIGLKKTRN